MSLPLQSYIVFNKEAPVCRVPRALCTLQLQTNIACLKMSKTYRLNEQMRLGVYQKVYAAVHIMNASHRDLSQTAQNVKALEQCQYA